MTKAILEFDLEDPDDREHHQVCVRAREFQCILLGLDEFLRSKIKYAPEDMSSKEIDIFQLVRDELHKLLTDYDVNLWS